MVIIMKWFKNIYRNTFINKWMKKILLSTKDHLGKESATRINGYLMSVMITLMVIVVCGIELGNMYIAFSVGDFYTVGYEFVCIFGMVLAHQLVLFNLKKSSEKSPFPTLEKMKGIDNKGNKDDE